MQSQLGINSFLPLKTSIVPILDAWCFNYFRYKTLQVLFSFVFSFVVLFNHITQHMLFFQSAARFSTYYIQYKNILKYSLGDDLISPKQSGYFWPENACINQLSSISHDIYTSCDNDLVVRAVCLELLISSGIVLFCLF